jgi:Flp pilus assembly pilin Flp
MRSLIWLIARLREDERGMELVEMAVLTALLVAAIVTSLVLLSSAIASRFGYVMDLI